MYSTNNSSSLQSSSVGGDVKEFDFQTFFVNNTSTANTNNNSATIISNNNHLQFFDSLPFLDPSPLPNPPATETPAPKNSKKRSRASRRAPTTVLTTDMSNFRAMVQEFTGIPARPFSSSGSTLSSSSYPRSRFDFFNPEINASSPSFLLRPYPQKCQAPSIINASSVTNRNTSSSNNYSNTNFCYLAGAAQSPILNLQLQSQLADLGVKAQRQQQQPMMMPSTSASHEYGVADHLGLPWLMGSGWGQDAVGDPTQLRQDVSRGEGMVESWISSSD